MADEHGVVAQGPHPVAGEAIDDVRFQQRVLSQHDDAVEDPRDPVARHRDVGSVDLEAGTLVVVPVGRGPARIVSGCRDAAHVKAGERDVAGARVGADKRAVPGVG